MSHSARCLFLVLAVCAARCTDDEDSGPDAGDGGKPDAAMERDAAPPEVDAGMDARVADTGSPAPQPEAGVDASDGEDAGPGEPIVAGKPVSQFFRDSCGGCHGLSRQGGICPPLIPSRLDKGKPFYADTIANGRPNTFMQAWKSTLSAEEIGYLVDFIYTEPSLDSVVWDIEQINANRKVLVDETTLPSSPTHAGNLDNLMLVTERESQSFAVVDGDTHAVLGHVQSSYRAHGYAFDPTNDRWAYNMGRDGWLFKVDLYTLQPVLKVRVGVDARGLAISDDGKYVIAGNYLPNTAVILDAATLSPLKVIYARGVDPDGVEVDSRVAIVSDVAPALVGPYFIIALKEAGQLWRIDYSKPDFPVTAAKNVGRMLHDGFLSPDNTRFYIASQGDDWMAVLDVASWKLIDLIPTGKDPHPGSGAAWTVGNVTYGATGHAGEGKVTIWDIGTGNIVGSVALSGPGLFIRSDANSPYVWADALFADPGHEITVFDGTSPTFEVVARLTDGTQTLHPEFTADGSRVYVADWKENVVRVYDAAYDSVNKTFPLITTITGIAAPTGIFCTARRHETLGH